MFIFFILSFERINFKYMFGSRESRVSITSFFNILTNDFFLILKDATVDNLTNVIYYRIINQFILSVRMICSIM